MTLNPSSVAPSPASSTSSSTASCTVVNASRLRENQRRSRARKKEYLLSLEARFQACQRTGIEANIDIQIAAKKVVRENLILRGMLKMRGVTDGEIDKTLKAGGEEGGVNGETAVEGVLKVLGKRPCSGGPTAGGTGMQCKPTGAPISQRMATERRNSTGMVAARDADRGGGRGAVTGLPTLAITTSKHPLSPQQLRHTPPSNYPYPSPTTPTPTPTATPLASTSNYPLASSSAHMNNFYNYGLSPSSSSQTSYGSPTISNSSPTSYTSYQMSPSISNSCCSQSFYPTTAQPQCSASSSSVAVSPSCCPIYSTTMSSPPGCSYQTAPISSTTPCHIAQSFINQLHPGLPGEDTNHLVNSICPPEMMENGQQCHVDNAVLFAVLDRI